MPVSAEQRKQLLDRAASLQARGMAALAQAPAPLRRALSGTRVRFRAEGGPTQSIAAPSSRSANLAGVLANDPRTINVMDEQAFQKAPEQLAVHEGMHLWQNSLPPSIQASIPADDPADPYKVPSTDAIAKLLQRGKNILALPKESQSATMQKYQADGGDKSAPQAERDTYGKLAQTMNSVPQSVIEGTDPDAAEINTHPRVPLPPADALDGGSVMPMQKIYPEKKKVDLSAGMVKKDPTKHKAGTVTAFDEESGLPIVRRHKASEPVKDEAKPVAKPDTSHSAPSNEVAKPEVSREKSSDKAGEKTPAKPEQKPKKAGSFGAMLAKGQTVHLNNGIKGTIQHVSSSMKIARIKTSDNHNLTVRHSQIAAVEDKKNAAETAATA